MIRMTATKKKRGLSRFGIATALVLAAAAWPVHADAFLVGAGILLGLSMAALRNTHDHNKPLALGHCPIDALEAPPRFAANRTGAKHSYRHRAQRNELTGELLERSRRRMTTSAARKRRYPVSAARSALAEPFVAAAGRGR